MTDADVRSGCAAPHDDGKPALVPRDGASAVPRRAGFPLQPAAGARAGTGLQFFLGEV